MKEFLSVTGGIALTAALLAACCLDGTYWTQALAVCVAGMAYALAAIAVRERMAA